MGLRDRIDMAAGREKAGLVLKNAGVVNVFTLEVQRADVAIAGDTIVGIGSYSGIREIDLAGKYLAPGFIDGHVHIESSMLTPSRFAQAIVPRGTTAVVADLHEIANVCGENGVRFMADDAKGLPLDVHIMVPSCVPATPFEEAGAVLGADAISRLMGLGGVLGLGEMMNYPGVMAGDAHIIKKIEAADGRPIDGHAPGLGGRALAAYAAAGPKTDHESLGVEEMLEKISIGFYVQLRGGSLAKDVGRLVGGINPRNMRRAMFCTDDRHPHDILAHGHIDHALRTAVACGLDPAVAVAMATLNAAECYGLKGVGAIAPGYRADIVVLDDLVDFRASGVYKNGVLAAENGAALFDAPSGPLPPAVVDTVRLDAITEDYLKMRLASDRAHVILPVRGSLETRKTTERVAVRDGFFDFSKDSGICKVAVLERHKRLGHIGLGLVRGFGIKDGAIAQTISHDSHNVIAVGDNDGDMVAAVNELAGGGGIAVAHGGAVIKALPLPVAGLMSDRPIDEVCGDLTEIENAVFETLGADSAANPLMLLSFLALPVIPELRITSRGMFDVTEFKFVDCKTQFL